MKLFATIPLCLSFAVGASEPGAPSSVAIEGRMELMAVDANDKLLIEKLDRDFKIPSDVIGCTLEVFAEDEYYNSYPGWFELRKFEEDEIAVFYRTKARWIDESGKYWRKPIQMLSLSIHDLVTNDWETFPLQDNTAIFAPSIEAGMAFFHHLTMGQPLTIDIQKSGNPNNVTITVKPLKANIAKHTRDCLKAINGEL